MINEFPLKINKTMTGTIPETDNLFKFDGSNTINKNKAELSHTTVDRGFSVCQNSGPKIQPTIAVYALGKTSKSRRLEQTTET